MSERKPRIHIDIQDGPIDIAALCERAGTDADGAALLFVGRARNHSNGKAVTHLDYEAYRSMAVRELEKIAQDACGRWDVGACAIVHRVGRVAIGEASICIAVSSPHRDDAYRASRFIIDTIKKTVPIWKKEYYEDGSMWISERG
ncbi:MAG TPA: molybdenum cofactor biosynthesis protein MoaE [Spirochaetota bacterium]|nr:molybdenum cofactor biosynthesis protein MoaE [Spirochaetota bacterium]HNT11056.1 molybdenum cofactor biosynthesis protein MoaE [Spirochaetota bacterium]